VSGFTDELRAAVRVELGEADDLVERVAEAAAQKVLAALDARESSTYLSTVQLAEHMGLSTRALYMRLRRGSSLSAIALTVDGRKVWRRRDVDALLSSKPRTGEK